MPAMVPDEKEAFQWLHPIRHLFHAMKDDLFYSSDGIIKVKTGSGLSEADRKKDPNEYIGKIIELEYNEITEDKSTGQKSLFLPIFVDVRTDKDKADDYQTILERSTAYKYERK